MARTVVSQKRLKNILSRELSQAPGCQDCQFGDVMPLRVVDESGCNWSEPVLTCSGVPAEVCRPAANIVLARMVLARIRERYNIET